MPLRAWLEGRLGLGISDDPRRVSVEARRTREVLSVRSTPGARVRLVRDGRSGEVQRALLWCVRTGVEVELAEGPSAILLDGVAVTSEALRRSGLKGTATP